jgi:SpoIID/LytB domain protein
VPELRSTSLRHRSALFLLVVASAAPVVAAAAPARAAAADVVIEGRGWGHGVGMAQDGALAMGRAGANVDQILDHFYPGTTDGSATGTVRVVLSGGAAPRVVVGFPGGGELRAAGSGPQPPGFPVVAPPGALVTVGVNGTRTLVGPLTLPTAIRPASLRRGGTSGVRLLSAELPMTPADPGSTTTTAPPSTTPPASPPPASPSPASPPPASPPPTSPPPASPPAQSRPAPPPPPAPPVAPPAPGDQALGFDGALAAVPSPGTTTLLGDSGRHYRGTLEIAGVGGGARVVDELDVEDYLRGMGEVRDPSWPAAGLQAQAVAARTYALHAMAGGGEICADDSCQVYLGADVEYPAMDAAVAATRSQVRRTGPALATTFYSANGGGVSATPEEGFGPGASDLPYLRAEPYQTDDPDPWTVRVDVVEAARRLGYPGRLSGVRITRTGASGRALEVVLEGDSGLVTRTGADFGARMQLRSTLFRIGADQPGTGAAASLPAPLTPAGPGGGLLVPWPGNAQAVADTSGGRGGDAIRLGAAAIVVLAIIVVPWRPLTARRTGGRARP